MELNLKIEMENEAFSECPEMEVARILRDAADKFESGSFEMPTNYRNLHDFNGNAVGKVRVK